MITVGNKLRILRKNRKISLIELSRATGMGYSFLSELENDKHSITIANLQKIADFFGVNLIYFLQEQEESNIKVTKASECKKFELKGGMIFEVKTPSNSQNLQISRVYLPVHTPRKPTMHCHEEGEEVVTVLKGTLFVSVGGNVYELSEKDTIFFKASYEHCMYTKENTAEFMLISSPPVGIEEQSN
jgi:transcriptional regulator with XRE-family HTH domain